MQKYVVKTLKVKQIAWILGNAHVSMVKNMNIQDKQKLKKMLKWQIFRQNTP